MENDWYVAIIDFGGFHYALGSPNGEKYKDFPGGSSGENVVVVAEVFDVSGETFERVGRDGSLEKICGDLDVNKNIDAQEDLDKLFKKE